MQHPWFIAALVYLMFAVGLSLSGVFTLGGSLGGMGQSLASRSGPVGDFFTGVLACVVASPCVAPFMGPALAYAFAAPGLQAMLVFLALGLGLALPFLLIGFVPSLARRLPRPGAWMETLKLVLAFPMYGTAIWLLWVLGKQRGVDAMALVLGGLVIDLRHRLEAALKDAYPAAEVDCTGAKAIQLSGGSLRREVDVVPASWNDTAEYQRTQSEDFRGVNILDKPARQLIDHSNLDRLISLTRENMDSNAEHMRALRAQRAKS